MLQRHKFPEQSLCFSQCPNKPGSWCPAGWRLVIHHCNTCPATGISLPILQGHLSLGPALTSALLRSTRVPWGVAEGFLLNETFAGALDPQRQAEELPSKQTNKKFFKKQPKGNCFIHCTFTSLSYCADEEKHSKQEATLHHPQPLWLFSLWTPVL